MLLNRPRKRTFALRFVKLSLAFNSSNSHFLIVFLLVRRNTSLGQILENCLELLRILDISPPKHTLAFTICYCSIRSMSDPRLDTHTASHFLQSSLVDQMYAKGVYFCSYVTKSKTRMYQIFTQIHSTFSIGLSCTKSP